MARLNFLKSALVGGASAFVLAGAAHARNFDIPSGDLDAALATYSSQSGIELIVSASDIKGIHTRGVVGDLSADAALTHILSGTGFAVRRNVSGKIGIAREDKRSEIAPSDELAQATPVRLAAAAAATGVETVVVTSSKIKGDIQTVPIAITALSQEQLTSRQIAGGPDLVKEVPNLTFSKTNFTGYNIQIRGIGTQAISVTTDPAVAVALNDIPFIRNHFFEQEFYDVGQVEVLRGPQGTLYGRNATAGVVNVISAKPTDQFEAMLSADWGNYLNRRYEGMVNIPIVDDRVDLRIAGEWTKRNGYTINENNGHNVDGRDLWSTRVTLGWKPVEGAQVYLVWEHFQESDDRMRTSKQLCKTDPGLSKVLGANVVNPQTIGASEYLPFTITYGSLSQGCSPVSLYDKGHPNATPPDYGAFGVPYGYSLGYVEAGYLAGEGATGPGLLDPSVNPYASARQSTNLRMIETQIDPKYIAKNDTLELNADYNITPALTFSSQTGYNNDFLWSTEDYNRFNTSPDTILFQNRIPPTDLNYLRETTVTSPDGNFRCADGSASPTCTGVPTGTFCDPQLGCSTRIVAQDLSKEHAWQLSQEFRLASNFTGPFNFSVGGNYMHYETVEDYYVFINTLTMLAATRGDGGLPPNTMPAWQVNGVYTGADNHECLSHASATGHGYQYHDPLSKNPGSANVDCFYIDPNPIGSVNGLGHSYFRSTNPYVLNSYAGFGEAYYNILNDVKLTGGVRWTDDEKHFIDIPSELLVNGIGYLPTGALDQKWNQWTGRLAANWTPKLDFTDQTLVYGSFAHGYKAGGANPPGAILVGYNGDADPGGIPVHPLTFKPEFVDAYELGSKNTLLDGGLTLNGDVFFYNYKGYQISKIVDRTAINDNFDATVKGAEVEAMYEPLPGLKFNFAGGYEDTRINNGQSSIDLMDRTAGHPGWLVMKPFVSEASNCVFPDYVVKALMTETGLSGTLGSFAASSCGFAYHAHLDPGHYVDPGVIEAYDPSTDIILPDGSHYTGFDPLAGAVDPLTGTIPDPYVDQNHNTYNGVTTHYGPAPNNGEGFAKNVGGNELPNAPHFTVSLSGEYTLPVSEDWAATLHGDFYWQSQSFARVFNDRPYDKIRGYSNVNLALILTSASGWQVMGYLKNVFDTTAITGAFLNSDDSGLTTNIFLTDPRLYGLRITKNW